MAHQARELDEVSKVFTEETANQAKAWRARVKEYEHVFAKSVEDLRALHVQQQQQLTEHLQHKARTRPSKVGDTLVFCSDANLARLMG